MIFDDFLYLDGIDIEQKFIKIYFKNRSQSVINFRSNGIPAGSLRVPLEGPWGYLGSSPWGPWGSLEGPWGVPVESLGVPWEVPGDPGGPRWLPDCFHASSWSQLGAN